MLLMREELTETVSSSPKLNHLLAALGESEYQRLLPDLEPILMPRGWMLSESIGHTGYLYFPITSTVSLLNVMTDGASGEVAVIGNEGVAGTSLFGGEESSPSRAVVQSAGYGYRIRSDVLERELAQGDCFQHLVLQFTQALIVQMSQTAICNRHHTLGQQLCRRLLMSLDRVPSNELVMTHELLSNLLGVRRESVTEAAGILQKEGMITYKRGHIIVEDRRGLEEHSCECYAVVKKEYDRLLYHGSGQPGLLPACGGMHHHGLASDELV